MSVSKIPIWKQTIFARRWLLLHFDVFWSQFDSTRFLACQGYPRCYFITMFTSLVFRPYSGVADVVDDLHTTSFIWMQYSYSWTTASVKQFVYCILPLSEPTVSLCCYISIGRVDTSRPASRWSISRQGHLLFQQPLTNNTPLKITSKHV